MLGAVPPPEEALFCCWGGGGSIVEAATGISFAGIESAAKLVLVGRSVGRSVRQGAAE